MEQIPAKRTKTIDEKFCSECGEIIRIKAEICPQCGVRQLPIPDKVDLVASQGKINFFCGNLVEKFSLASGISFPIFILLTLAYAPDSKPMDSAIGSLMFAAIGGVVAMALPTVRKIIYLPISITMLLFIAMLIGFSMD